LEYAPVVDLLNPAYIPIWCGAAGAFLKGCDKLISTAERRSERKKEAAKEAQDAEREDAKVEEQRANAAFDRLMRTLDELEASHQAMKIELHEERTLRRAAEKRVHELETSMHAMHLRLIASGAYAATPTAAPTLADAIPTADNSVPVMVLTEPPSRF
jgi:hypothetical protein